MIANCQAGNILLIAYSFSCDSFDCELWKNSQFAIKRISQSKPDLRYAVYCFACLWWVSSQVYKDVTTRENTWKELILYLALFFSVSISTTSEYCNFGKGCCSKRVRFFPCRVLKVKMLFKECVQVPFKIYYNNST